jgi:hypothetical protein
MGGYVVFMLVGDKRGVVEAEMPRVWVVSQWSWLSNFGDGASLGTDETWAAWVKKTRNIDTRV